MGIRLILPTIWFIHGALDKSKIFFEGRNIILTKMNIVASIHAYNYHYTLDDM